MARYKLTDDNGVMFYSFDLETDNVSLESLALLIEDHIKKRTDYKKGFFIADQQLIFKGSGSSGFSYANGFYTNSNGNEVRFVITCKKID